MKQKLAAGTGKYCKRYGGSLSESYSDERYSLMLKGTHKYITLVSIYLAYFSQLQEAGPFISFPLKFVLSFPLPCHTRTGVRFCILLQCR